MFHAFATLLFAFALALAAPAAAERRVALVIGNDAYRTVPALSKAVNDARAMADRLEPLGFEVILRENAGRRATNQALTEFTARLAGAEVGLFFFAGHGVQFEGRNILLPVDIPLPRTEADVVDEGIDLGRVLERMAGTGVRFASLIIDACRDNPLPKVGTRSIGATRGLAMPAAPNGVYIAYSAGVNEQALDRLGPDDRDPNGVFMRNLLPLLGQPGLSFDEMVKQARENVRRQAASIGHQQNPAIYDQTTGDFYLVPAIAAIVPKSALHAPQTAPAADKELVFWEAIKESRDAAAFEAYLRQYPSGAFAELARYRAAALAPAPRQPVAPGPAASPSAFAPPPMPQPAPAPSAAPALDKSTVAAALDRYFAGNQVYENSRIVERVDYIRSMTVEAGAGETVTVSLDMEVVPLFVRDPRFPTMRLFRKARLRREGGELSVLSLE